METTSIRFSNQQSLSPTAGRPGRSPRRHIWLLAAAIATLVLPTTLRAQDIVKDALASFPPQTIRLEYSRSSKLRALPNYARLHQRYVGPWLGKLEASLEQIGIREEDVDELVLGWEAGTGEMNLYGLATGRFNPKTTAQIADSHSLTPTQVAGLPAYCLEAGVAGTCVAVLKESRGAFGKLGSLTSLLEARSGQGVGLDSDQRFVKLATEARSESPIWGVALGPAVIDWFKGWMPGQTPVELDWARVFGDVQSLLYSVDVGSTVGLNLKLNCSGPKAAASLRQVLEGLKIVQQLAWQSQNPDRPNPFNSMVVELNDQQVAVKVATDYSALENVGVRSAPDPR